MFIQNVAPLLFTALLSFSAISVQAKSIPEKTASTSSYKLPRSEYIKKEDGKIKFYSIPPLSKETLQILTVGGIGAMAISGYGVYDLFSREAENQDVAVRLALNDDDKKLILLCVLGALGFTSTVIGGVTLYGFDDYYKKPVLEFDKNGLNYKGSWFAWKNVASVKIKNKQEIIGYGRHQQVHTFDYIAIRLNNGALHEIRHSGIAIKLTELLDLINISWESAKQPVEAISQ